MPTKEGEEVATGICKLRPELPRVPATMAKCAIYKQRGAFRYDPGRPSSPRRRRNKVLKVVRVERDGTEVSVTPPRRVAAPRTPVEREPPPPRPRPPETIDLGDDASRPLVRQALVEMLRHEHGRSRRELHTKYARGGVVKIVDAEGGSRSVPAERFFAMLDRLQSSLAALEGALDARSEGLGTKVSADLVAQLGRMRGTLTTFNVMFQHKEDHFRSK